jgi:hypothetical protein
MFKPSLLETSFLVDIRFRLPFRCKNFSLLYNERRLSFSICLFFEFILTLPTTYLCIAQVITRANHTLIRVSQKMLMHVKRGD